MLDASSEIERLRAALGALLRFHAEGDDGAELPRELWAVSYRAAVEGAEAALTPNAQGNAPSTALKD
jgi:hypothetical protein